jgi:hypothetical protein
MSEELRCGDSHYRAAPLSWRSTPSAGRTNGCRGALTHCTMPGAAGRVDRVGNTQPIAHAVALIRAAATSRGYATLASQPFRRMTSNVRSGGSSRVFRRRIVASRSACRPALLCAFARLSSARSSSASSFRATSQARIASALSPACNAQVATRCATSITAA